jgi:3'-phosphoadenosine 5'-phosphosulfate sulfotransferase (PAPS reductase)/FAD synthetase
MTQPMSVIAPMHQYRKENIEEMMAWSLERKIEHAKKRIQEFYEVMDGKVYVSFSGGKDSTVLLHLVRSIFPDVVAVFVNTTNEYIEILYFVNHTKNVITLYPKMSFNQTIEKYGFPLVSKKVARSITDLRENKPTTANIRNLYLTGYNRKGVYVSTYKLAKKWYPLFQEAQFNITNKCCDILKKEPAHRFQKETGLFPFVGTMAYEGTDRKMDWIKNGCNLFNEEKKTFKSRPLSIWTEQDIWDYIKLYDVPYSKIYDDIVDDQGNVIIQGEKRTGCAYCAFGADQEKGINRFQRLKLRKPKQYSQIMQLKNNGITFSEALDFIKVAH